MVLAMVTQKTIEKVVITMEVDALPSSPSLLCLGPKQSGKTHLLASLQSIGAITNVSHSVPTIGTNIFAIKLPGTQKAASSTNPSTTNVVKPKPGGSAGFRRSVKNKGVNIMEIGGSMAPMWTNYLNNVSKILYVIDTSNLCQISAAGRLLIEIMRIFSHFFLFFPTFSHFV